MSATGPSTAVQPAPTKTHPQLAAREATGNRQETSSGSTSTADKDTRWKLDTHSRLRQEPEREPHRYFIYSGEIYREIGTIGEILKTELPSDVQGEIREALREAAAEDRDEAHLRRSPTRLSYPSYSLTASSDQSTRQADVWSGSDGRGASQNGSPDTMEVGGLDKVFEDHSFAGYPSVDTLHDESVAYWPTVTCSELGSKRIRLVKIVPGPAGSIVECKICNCFLDQTPSYTAISYTWGSPLGFREILIEGHPCRVAKNLWRFLDQARKLRYVKDLTRWIWIDALSIDQSDPQEKLDQVGIISSIFRNAERMIVWLGPSYENSDHALAALRRNRTNRTQQASRTLADPVWSALHNLCERPYWRRLWVYQELKSTWDPWLMCGNGIVELRSFQAFLLGTLALRSEGRFKILQESPAAKILKLVEDPAKTSLVSSIRETCHLRCTDPRDKAYAILNLVHTGKLGIKADYTITVPVLLNRILMNMHEMSPPTSLHQVAEQCMELERLFGEPSNTIFETKSPMVFSRDVNPLEQFASRSASRSACIDMKLLELSKLQEPSELQELLTLMTHLLSWCGFYSHKSIRQLFSLPFDRIVAGQRLSWEITDLHRHSNPIRGRLP